MGLEKTVGTLLAAALLLSAGLLQAQVPSGDFQVNSYTTGAQHTPRVAVAAGGDFVVVWTSAGSPGSDTSYSSIQGQRFARDGAPLGGQFQVNSITTYHQRDPSVAIDGDGDFVVVWEVGDYAANVKGQRFSADGSPAGDEFLIDGFGYGDPSVAIGAGGDFVVVWEYTYYYSHLPGQRYAADGSPAGHQLSIGDVASYELDPAVAAADNGDFVVVWASRGFNDDGSTFYDVRGRRFGADGRPLGGRFQVNSYSTGRQRFPSVAATAGGDFVVVWESDASSGSEISSRTVQGQRFAADGSPLGGELRINSYVPEFLDSPSVAVAEVGDVLVVWESDGSTGSDTSSSSIQGRRLRLGCVPAAAVLCLGERRFGLTVEWRDFQGRTGAGTAVPMSGESGYFWFFDHANVELIVKVLDACGLPTFRSYWVFATGLTSVEVTLRVTDTVSGTVREYVNPLGMPFRPIQDTDAFATCP